MKAAARLAAIVLAGVVALALGYAAARALGDPVADRVPAIDLDNLPPIGSRPTTQSTDPGATVVPPPTLTPPPSATPPPPPPPPPPGDDDDDDNGTGDD
ncbi:MAG: hypothetical protein ACRD0U_11175 [Acidimicrobiales bacterium]